MSNAAYSITSSKTLSVASPFGLLNSFYPQPATLTPAEYTGEELFRGLFFFEGQVAAQIPSFDAYRALRHSLTTEHPERLARHTATLNALVQTVRSNCPTYFAELKQAIQSGSKERIKVALRQGTALSEAAALATLTTPEARQAFLARRHVIQTLNLGQYNFKREKDIRRFQDDIRQALREAGYRAGVAQDAPVVITESVHAWLDQLADPSSICQKQAAKLIEELAGSLHYIGAAA
ncbi:hypothetical protein [Hymenobacter lucidus]|uniref:Uncharacterized protein n=1 Tax=Hymenobacter lucidus TaxID=2880930 RepID=A0ABS8APY8_9BACT|nr:hypothetical protein [Hymenobacter lucidus]MCB2408275.1 hypothetical protein [Hymenobacter lucidus]